MDQSDKTARVLALFEAFLEQDRDAAEKLLGDEFTFTSPYDDRIDKATYFERCWPNRGHIVSQTLKQVCVRAELGAQLSSASAATTGPSSAAIARTRSSVEVAYTSSNTS